MSRMSRPETGLWRANGRHGCVERRCSRVHGCRSTYSSRPSSIAFQLIRGGTFIHSVNRPVDRRSSIYPPGSYSLEGAAREYGQATTANSIGPRSRCHRDEFRRSSFHSRVLTALSRDLLAHRCSLLARTTEICLVEGYHSPPRRISVRAEPASIRGCPAREQSWLPQLPRSHQHPW